MNRPAHRSCRQKKQNHVSQRTRVTGCPDARCSSRPIRSSASIRPEKSFARLGNGRCGALTSPGTLIFMKFNKFSPSQNQEPTSASRSTAPEDVGQRGIDFAPSADEVARRAYFNYVNQGSQPGHDVQHWLVAEAELLAERNITRVHGSHHPRSKQKAQAAHQEEIDL